jgi:membrane protein
MHGARRVHWSHVHEMLRFAQRRLVEERLPQVAGSLTFTTVLALVPVLTIAFAIFTTFPLFNTFRASLEGYFIQSLMPKTISNTIIAYLNQFAAKASRLSAVGGVALIFTAVAMLNTIDRVFNHIWRVKKRRARAQRILVYWAIVTLGPLMIGVSITVTSYLFTATSGVVSQVPFLSGVFYTLFSLALSTGAFTLLYMAIPNRFIDWRDAAWGGAVAAVAFEIAKRLFAAFITQFPTYTVVYGALAALPIFLVWIYVSWLITLIGAVIAASLPVIKYERWWHVPTPASAFLDAMAIIEILYDAREHGGSSAVDANMIRERTRLGFDESEILLEKMLSAGWVGRIRPDEPTRTQWGKRITEGMDMWTLLANPHHLTLADVYRMFLFDTSHHAGLARHVEAAIERGLDETLTAYFRRTRKNGTESE